ncbi:hypothetical protein [Streptomyces koyangensis]|nr:hypothetical protein [Streptomyces koyangensis]
MTEATDGPLSRALLRLMPNLNERQRRLAWEPSPSMARPSGVSSCQAMFRSRRVVISPAFRSTAVCWLAPGPEIPAGWASSPVVRGSVRAWNTRARPVPMRAARERLAQLLARGAGPQLGGPGLVGAAEREAHQGGR